MGFLYPSTCTDMLFVCLLYFTGFFTSYIGKTHFNMFSISESQDEKRINKFCLLETKLSHFPFLPKLCKQMLLLLQVIYFRISSKGNKETS